MKAHIPYSTKAISGVLQHKNLTYVANARQSIVYKHNDIIVKAVSNFGETDPTYQFLRICMNHPTNPFFPTIYKAKQYPAKTVSAKELAYIATHATEMDGKPPRTRDYVLIITTEYLVGLDLSDQLSGYLIQIGIYGIILRFRETSEKFRAVYAPLGPAHWHSLDAIGFAVYEAFQDANARLEMRLATTNKDFANALRLLEPLFSNANSRPDVHFGGNILFRGMQFVINDPITYRRQIELDATTK